MVRKLHIRTEAGKRRRERESNLAIADAKDRILRNLPKSEMSASVRDHAFKHLRAGGREFTSAQAMKLSYEIDRMSGIPRTDEQADEATELYYEMLKTRAPELEAEFWKHYVTGEGKEGLNRALRLFVSTMDFDTAVEFLHRQRRGLRRSCLEPYRAREA